MKHRKLFTALALGAMTFGLSTGAALAQSADSGDAMQAKTGMQQHDMKSMHKGNMGMHMQGRHMMPATVTSVDKKTGKMSVNAGGMDLKVHFPPASLTDVKEGDKITLMLGFRKGDMKAMHKDRMMKDKSMKNKDSMDHDSMDHDKDNDQY